LPGDRGFDPLGLGSDADRLKWYAEAEKTNGRWAMAAVAGILGQELLGVTPVWFNAGLKEYALPQLGLLAIEALVMGFLELKRFQGWKETGQSGFLDSYPFDPVGLNSQANAEKEIKNGRLAMVAFLGFAVQAIVTREGPVEGLFHHINDPFGHNILSNIGDLPKIIGATPQI
jgi:light-harvesting complex I chlorophyll a/b binding protein 5